MKRWLRLFCLFILVMVAGNGCSGCAADDDANRGRTAEQTGDFVGAAEAYIDVCTRYSGTNACNRASKRLPAVRLGAGKQLVERHQYAEAKRMLDPISAASGDIWTHATELLRSPEVLDGVRFDEARHATSGDPKAMRDALVVIEGIEASKTAVGPLAQAWLEKNGASDYLALAKLACGKKPEPECGTYLERLGTRYVASTESKAADPLRKSYAKLALDEGDLLDGQGKLPEAALRYDEVCRRGPATDACKHAFPKAESARLRGAQKAMDALAFSDAKALYEQLATSKMEWIRRQAQAQLDSDALRSGLALETARKRAAGDARAELPEMETVAKSSSRAGREARAWIAKERPALYLEDANAACLSLTEECGPKARRLMTSHPGTSQAAAAAKLLDVWEHEPFVAAEQLAKEGRLLDAAAEYDRVCAREPESTVCKTAAPLAFDTRSRGAEDAAGTGRFLDAKKAYETLLLTTKDASRRDKIGRRMATPEFAAGLARDLHDARVAAVRNTCGEGLPECPAAVAEVMHGDPAVEAEGTRLLKDFSAARVASDAALATAEVAASKCGELSQAEHLVAACFPGKLAQLVVLPTDSPIDRLALAVGYVSGGDGPPSPGIARRGLVLLGLVLGVTAGLGIQLARARRPYLGAITGTSGVVALTILLLATGSFAKTRERYASVGLDERTSRGPAVPATPAPASVASSMARSPSAVVVPGIPDPSASLAALPAPIPDPIPTAHPRSVLPAPTPLPATPVPSRTECLKACIASCHDDANCERTCVSTCPR